MSNFEGSEHIEKFCEHTYTHLHLWSHCNGIASSHTAAAVEASRPFVCPLPASRRACMTPNGFGRVRKQISLLEIVKHL